jgi:PP-loop superfamily ATP-utilizing enzyme
LIKILEDGRRDYGIHEDCPHCPALYQRKGEPCLACGKWVPGRSWRREEKRRRMSEDGPVTIRRKQIPQSKKDEIEKRLTERCHCCGYPTYRSLTELAEEMNVSVTTVGRIRQEIGQQTRRQS